MVAASFIRLHCFCDKANIEKREYHTDGEQKGRKNTILGSEGVEGQEPRARHPEDLHDIMRLESVGGDTS